MRVKFEHPKQMKISQNAVESIEKEMKRRIRVGKNKRVRGFVKSAKKRRLQCV